MPSHTNASLCLRQSLFHKLGRIKEAKSMGELAQLKAELVAAGQRIVARGLVAMTGGNLSARVPGSDAIMITPTGYDLAEFQESDLVTVDQDGNPIEGDLKPSSEMPM